MFHDPLILLSIEDAVSKHTRKEWRVLEIKDMSDYACHPCAILSDSNFPVFVKYSDALDAAQQFEIEMDSLQYLAMHTGVMIPTSIGIVPVKNGTVFIMEALEPVERGVTEWKQIGRTLARIHRIHSDTCGFYMNKYFGPLHQDNTPHPDWITFFRERRLIPYLQLAVDSGNLPTSVVLDVESIIRRLPELCDNEMKPVLLHGEAQKNNFICTSKGTYVIDPAIYYGNAELDLAYLGTFEPVPQDVFDGYQEEMPIDPGFKDRYNLWRLSLLLPAVALEGTFHLNRLTDAIKGYL